MNIRQVTFSISEKHVKTVVSVCRHILSFQETTSTEKSKLYDKYENKSINTNCEDFSNRQTIRQGTHTTDRQV